jgi:hypothetical protein
MAVVTCHTPECGNAGHAIEMDLTVYDENGDPTEYTMGAACGVCGQPITDITE